MGELAGTPGRPGRSAPHSGMVETIADNQRTPENSLRLGQFARGSNTPLEGVLSSALGLMVSHQRSVKRPAEYLPP